MEQTIKKTRNRKPKEITGEQIMNYATNAELVELRNVIAALTNVLNKRREELTNILKQTENT